MRHYGPSPVNSLSRNDKIKSRKAGAHRARQASRALTLVEASEDTSWATIAAELEREQTEERLRSEADKWWEIAGEANSDICKLQDQFSRREWCEEAREYDDVLHFDTEEQYLNYRDMHERLAAVYDEAEKNYRKAEIELTSVLRAHRRVA